MFSLRWNRARFAKYEHVTALFVFTAIVFSIVYGCDNLHAPPRLVDENQIFFLDHGIAERGFPAVASEHFLDRLLRMRRFLPVFIVHKLLQVAMFGTNLFLWSIYTAVLAVLSAFILYFSGRLLRLSYLESMLFALIVVVGEQSVLWWRLFHGEGVGLLFVALAMLAAGLHYRSPERRLRWSGAFCLFATAASLSKESFILLLPAMVYTFLWIDRRRTGERWMGVVMINRFLIGTLAAVCLLELLIIKFGLNKTDFYYTGWRGFHANQLQYIFGQFFDGHRLLALYVPLLAMLVFVAYSWLSRSGVKSISRLLRGCAELSVLAILVLTPQFLLYMSSGFEGGMADYSRFLIPSTLGLAAIVVLPLSIARWESWSIKRRYRPQFRLANIVAALSVLSMCLVAAYGVAHEGAMDYAQHTEELSSFYDEITENTHADSPIVVAVIESKGFEARRLTILLKLYLNRNNLYFLPCRTDESDDTLPFQFGWIAQDNMTQWVESRIVSSVDEVGDAAMVVLAGASGYAQSDLLEEADYLLDQTKFSRFRSVTGDYMCFSPIEDVTIYASTEETQ